MKCPFCGYQWEERNNDPVSCPRCKKRFDYPGKVKRIVGGKE